MHVLSNTGMTATRGNVYQNIGHSHDPAQLEFRVQRQASLEAATAMAHSNIFDGKTTKNWSQWADGAVTLIKVDSMTDSQAIKRGLQGS